MTNDKFTTQRVIGMTYIAPNLCHVILERPSHFKFTAGQFARVGILIDDRQTPPAWLFRALSVVSSPFADTLEFLISIIPDGAFSDALAQVTVGGLLAVERVPYGYLTLARFQQPQPKDLWLLATGTGAAPFFSMLQDFATWQAYQQIVFVYSVRHTAELAFVAQIKQWESLFNERQITFKFIPIVTREPQSELPTALQSRLPVVIASGDLEQAAGVQFSVSSSHVLICGNPQMVEDTRNALKAKGLSMNRRGEGNIAVENYW